MYEIFTSHIYCLEARNMRDAVQVKNKKKIKKAML